MLTAVDPYSGAFASSESLQSFDRDMTYQKLTVQPIAGQDFERGLFELLQGEKHATAMVGTRLAADLVENGEVPGE